MTSRWMSSAVIIVLSSSTVFAAVAAKKDKPRSADTRPTSSPATTQAAHFPTPQELFEKIRSAKEAKKKLKQVAYFDLSHPITEKPQQFSIFRDNESQTLRAVLERLQKAKDDADIKAVLITATDPQINLAQAQEIRDALLDLRKAKKKVFVYADAYDTATYTMATGASDVCMLAGGEIMIPGIGLETMFAKGLLDKVGVQADYVQIGEYKGADEMYTRVGPSDEFRGELNRLTDSLFDQVVSAIAANRKLPADKVRAAIDQALITGNDAKKLGLVDHLIDVDGMRDLIAKKVGGEINLIHDYGAPEEEETDFSNPWALFAKLAQKPAETHGPKVAIIYAEGQIIDGDGGDSMWGGSYVGSEDLRKAFRMAARDEDVKAIVVRIDSPGGSALASEAMWQAARRAATTKPVVVSIGSMAASGGYYLASAGDYVIADPTAIVGSIGVVGGKFVMKDLYAKLGLTTESFARGNNADLFSSSHPFTDKQREMVTGWMKQTYDQFTQRILTMRGKKIADIDKVARGRIFVAKQAKELGMVDEIGGMHRAISYAADKVGLKDGDYEIRTFPPAKTLADYFMGNRDAKTPIPAAMFGLTQDSILRSLPSSIRTPIFQQIQALRLLEQRPVVLISPYTITIR